MRARPPTPSAAAAGALLGAACLVACGTDVRGPAVAAASCGETAAGADLQACAACAGAAGACPVAAPIDACCAWVAPPAEPLAVASGLHRFSAPAGAPPAPSTACFTAVAPLGAPELVTLTGYVWLFDGGDDSAGVEVQVFAENAPNTDGSLAAAAVGAYTTGAGDPIDPTDTTWNAACDNGCSYRQYAIANVPTETPLVVVTTDGGAMQWATRYEYGVVLSNADVAGGVATFDATAVQAETLVTLAQSVGLTIGEDQGLLVGEVHDCADLRLAGAVVGTDAPDTPATYYFTGTEALPTPSREQRDTTSLGLYGLVDLPSGARRVSAVGQDPSTAGQVDLLGSYTVQVFPGAMTALVLRGRRAWQP